MNLKVGRVTPCAPPEFGHFDCLRLPEGDSKIARQFTAGFESAVAQVPQGRLNLPLSCVSSCSHCVFSAKDRQPFITPRLRERLWPFLWE